MSVNKVVFAGIEMMPFSLTDSLNWIMEKVKGNGFHYVVTPNAAHVVKYVEEFPRVGHLYKDAHLCVNDSRIIRKFARYLGMDIPVCPGSDLTAALLERLNEESDPCKIAIIGGEDYYLPLLHEKYAQLSFEQYVPPMGFIRQSEEVEKTMDFLKDSDASVFFFAVGMPQQEILAWKSAYESDMKGIGLCIGASIDFIVGKQKRAPKIWQDLSLEWLHRLLSDPKRMAKRYLVESPRMFKYALKYRTVDQLKKRYEDAS